MELRAVHDLVLAIGSGDGILHVVAPTRFLTGQAPQELSQTGRGDFRGGSARRCCDDPPGWHQQSGGKHGEGE